MLRLGVTPVNDLNVYSFDIDQYERRLDQKFYIHGRFPNTDQIYLNIEIKTHTSKLKASVSAVLRMVHFIQYRFDRKEIRCDCIPLSSFQARQMDTRMTTLETRFDTILPTLATKEDLKNLEIK